jgi:cytochrome c553
LLLNGVAVEGMLGDMPHRHLWMALLVCALGCPRAEPGPSEPSVSTEPAVADAPRERPPEGALEKARRSVTEAMPGHFEHAVALEQAIIDGDFRAARASATALAQHRPDRYPESWAPFVLRMRALAEDAAKAEDLDSIASATGTMMGSCGSCHEALGAKVASPVEPEPPADAVDLATTMRRHRWAATRLRAGIVEPSARAWGQGVEAFTPLPMPDCPEDSAGDVDVEALRDRFGTVLEEARVVESLESRASVYGRLLGTCAGCHTGC